MAVQKETKEATTFEESLQKGFFGIVANAYPNSFHTFGNEADRYDEFGATELTVNPEAGLQTGATTAGAVVNSNDAPTPSGGKSGPGAATDTSKDDKK